MCWKSTWAHAAAPGARPGWSLQIDEGLDRAYIEHLAGTMSGDLKGMKIVLDGANGAASFLAPALFRKLGAEINCIHPRARQKNINLNCGSTAFGIPAVTPCSRRAPTLGVAFDGDADRALFVSRSGKIVDGDAVLYLSALPLHAISTAA